MSKNDRNLNLERILSIILKMKTKLPETIFFEDELNDEFSTAKIQAKKIDKNYRYLHKTIFGEILHFLCYRVIATPIAKIYLKAKFHHKIVGKEKMKEVKDTGYFLYGNHTQQMADALIPSFVAFPKGIYVIVHPNNVSMKVFGKVTPYLGALPLPDDLGAMKNFLKAIEKRLDQKKAICIYPEAHIWPYYTKIRPFTEKSFHYPVKYQKPVFCFTNTYQKRKNGKVQIITYIDGPFYPDPNLNQREDMKRLRDLCYEAMVRESQKNTIEVIRYERKKEND